MMILLHTKNIILAGVTLGFLAACSSTTTNSGGGGVIPGDTDPKCETEGDLYNDVKEACYDPTDESDENHPNHQNWLDSQRNGVTTGVLDGLISSNGLAFADLNYGNAAKGEINGDTLTLRALKLVRTLDGETPSLSAELVNATITVFKGEDDKEWHALVVIDGVISPEFELKSGHDFEYLGTTYTLHVNEATNIFTIDAKSTINPNFDAVVLDGVSYLAYTGFETDPAILDLLVGQTALANYAGEFDVLLASSEVGDLSIVGDIEFTANFEAGTIADGTLTDTDFTVNFSGDIEVEGTGGISGNGWNATIDGITYGSETLADGGGQLDGVFYGAVGEETAGTIIVDAELTDGTLWDGGGGFVAMDCGPNPLVDDFCVDIIIP